MNTIRTIAAIALFLALQACGGGEQFETERATTASCQMPDDQRAIRGSCGEFFQLTPGATVLVVFHGFVEFSNDTTTAQMQSRRFSFVLNGIEGPQETVSAQVGPGQTVRVPFQVARPVSIEILAGEPFAEVTMNSTDASQPGSKIIESSRTKIEH